MSYVTKLTLKFRFPTAKVALVRVTHFDRADLVFSVFLCEFKNVVELL